MKKPTPPVDFRDPRELAALPQGTPLAVALSGGADSVMLAYLILEYRRRHKDFPVVLCHVNHGIRGDDADADEAFCRAFAKRRGKTRFL